MRLANICLVSRGYKKAGQGNPDEARGARYLLKDYVNGKLLYVFPPPDALVSVHEIFKKESVKRMLFIRAQKMESKKSDSNDDINVPPMSVVPESSVSGFGNEKSVDAGFVGKFSQKGFARVQLYPHQQMEGEQIAKGDKKHKKGKRGKTRDAWTTDYNY